MGLSRREGGLGFDWQLSSLLWACLSLPPPFQLAAEASGGSGAYRETFVLA